MAWNLWHRLVVMSHNSSPRVAAGGGRSQAPPDPARPAPRWTCGQVLLKRFRGAATLKEREGKPALYFCHPVCCQPRGLGPHSSSPSVSI